MSFNVPHRVVQPTPFMGHVEPQGGMLTKSYGTQEIQDTFVILFPPYPYNFNKFAT